MKILNLKRICFLVSLTVGLNAYAVSELGLEDLRKEVLSNNLDIQIQYENYYQAQKNVSVALGQFLPSANINLFYVNRTLAILQSVVPTPSGWFNYKASQELEVAEKFTSESIRLNILEGLTVNFINIKYHEKLLASFEAQEKVLEVIYEEAKKSEELGMSSPSDVFLARRNLSQHQQDIFLLKSLIIAQKEALLIALNRQPNEVFVLANLPTENLDVIPTLSADGAKLAVDNSTELLSNAYQLDAAYYMTRASKWSFVSFNGIGFDYSANVAINQSKARVIELQGTKTYLTIKNQVYSAYETIDLLDRRIELQKAVLESLIEIDERNNELYAKNALSQSKYYESKSDVIAEDRTLLRLEMERRVKIAQLVRLMGLDSSLNGVESQAESIYLAVTQEAARRGNTHVWINLEGAAAQPNNVFSVEYTIENIFSKKKVYGASGSLSIYFKATQSNEYIVTAKIMMLSGEIINKELKVSTF